jgi:prevent-host-death family protein
LICRGFSIPILTVAEAQIQLPQLIDQLRPGEEVIITRNNQRVARLTAKAMPKGVQGMDVARERVT